MTRGVAGIMRIQEIFSSKPPLEMSYSRKKAEAVITGVEKPINDHLLRLLIVGGEPVKHWAAELLEWLDEVAEIRLKPDNRPGPASFYYRILFDEPFGGTGIMNVARRSRRLERQGYAIQRDADLDIVLQKPREFHEAFSDACAQGVETEEIEAMLANMAL